MALDLGDPVPLSVFVTDDNGNAANSTTVVLTLTLPDGTTVTPAIANPVTGTYVVTGGYLTAQAGRHAVRWLGTGVNFSAYTDSFDVLPADPGFLFGLADARAICRIPTADTSSDELLRSYNAAVTLVVEYLCGKQTRKTVTQAYDGGSAGILLPSNLISVDSVVENTLTLTAADYTVDPRACILYRGSPLAVFSFIPGIQNVSVTFTKGNAVIPQNVLTGGELILRHFWQGTQNGNRPQFGSPDTGTAQTTNVLGYLIPNPAMAFLKASPALPGFA